MQNDHSDHDWVEAHREMMARYADAGQAPPPEAYADHPLLLDHHAQNGLYATLLYDLPRDRMLRASKGLEALIGIRADEWVDIPVAVVHQRIHPVDQSRTLLLIQAGYAHLDSQPHVRGSWQIMLNHRFVHRSGDPVWIQSVSTPLYVNPANGMAIIALSLLLPSLPSVDGLPTCAVSYERQPGRRELYVVPLPSTGSTPEFTPRELSVLRLLAQGKTSRDIAVLLELSTESVNKIRKRLLELTAAKNSAELVRYALERRLI